MDHSATPVPGYHGRYLRIDLSSQSAVPVPIPGTVYRRFIGGVGLGTWILLQETGDAYDALAADAPLAFVFSPLVGSPLTTSAKFAVLCKSPLTQRLNDSLASSQFALSGKKTGYDAILIRGEAAEPTCLLIDEDGVRFATADDVWGLSPAATTALLRDRFGRGYRFAAIGPAGENQIRYATISHDGRHAGRGGSGAVMGAKHLKAIGVSGQRSPSFADPRQLSTYSKSLSRLSMGPATAKYRELGTVTNLLTFNRLGTLPTRNFQDATFDSAASLAPPMDDALTKRTRASCAACTIGCEHIFHAQDQPDGVRLEYESLFALGSLCGIEDFDTVLQAAGMCDEFGMDTISSGSSIAFGMECAEKGLLDAPDLRFGNSRALLATLEDIAFRRGLGDLLANGTRDAATHIGGDAADFAPHVKGLEIPGYEPRALQTMALGFAVNARGADHNRSGAYQIDFSDQVDRMHIDRQAVKLAIDTEDEAAIMDSLILCKFLRGALADRWASMADMLKMTTGFVTDAEELVHTAQRIVSAKKLFNIRQGWAPAEDTLPKRFLTSSLTSGASQGASISHEQLQELIAEYNRLRQWSPEGWLGDELIRTLQLLDCE